MTNAVTKAIADTNIFVLCYTDVNPIKTFEINTPSCEKQQFVVRAPLDHQLEPLHSVTVNAKKKKKKNSP